MNSFNNQYNLIWGCDKTIQYEASWINSLFCPYIANDINLLTQNTNKTINTNIPMVLVESGINWLHRPINVDLINFTHNQRIDRISNLSKYGPITLIHISDEEGNDAKNLYPILPIGTKIFRNFFYSDLLHRSSINVFPIGPRDEFLKSVNPKISSERSFPWAFMGTLWRSGPRTKAVSLFLRSLPHGFFYGSKSFGMGLEISTYKNYLLDSKFALCPEGDRHFDTFRLYEAMQAGSIPLVVEKDGQALATLGSDFPVPIHSSWDDALEYAITFHNDIIALDNIQKMLINWWGKYKSNLSQKLIQSLNY